MTACRTNYKSIQREGASNSIQRLPLPRFLVVFDGSILSYKASLRAPEKELRDSNLKLTYPSCCPDPRLVRTDSWHTQLYFQNPKGQANLGKRSPHTTNG
jgi:hypothetical protein